MKRLRIWRMQLWRLARGVSPVHCWEGGPDVMPGGVGTTCMRWDGHLGKHEWTPDSDIGLRFT